MLRGTFAYCHISNGFETRACTTDHGVIAPGTDAFDTFGNACDAASGPDRSKDHPDNFVRPGVITGFAVNCIVGVMTITVGMDRYTFVNEGINNSYSDSEYGSYKCARDAESDEAYNVARTIILSENGESGSFGNCIPMVAPIAMCIGRPCTEHGRESDCVMHALTINYMHPNSVGYNVGTDREYPPAVNVVYHSFTNE